jgi:hypothetical protein
LISIFPSVCNSGSRSESFFGFLGEHLPKLTDAKPILQSLVASLRSESQAIQRLPGTHLYSQLSQYIDVPASYLDLRPCAFCNDPERQPSKLPLGDVKEASRFTFNEIFVRLKQPVVLQSFALSIGGKRT